MDQINYTPIPTWGVGVTPKKGVLFVAFISLQFWGEVHPFIFAAILTNFANSWPWTQDPLN